MTSAGCSTGSAAGRRSWRSPRPSRRRRRSESVGSVGLRLAYQLERTLDAQVVVAALDTSGVRVIGVSGRADRRLNETVLPSESELARMAQGGVEPYVSSGDPLGSVVADRRTRPVSVLLLPMRVADKPVGAVAIWLTSGREPVGAVRAEVNEALDSAAPRIARALEADQDKRAATVDPLTGLHNRRGFDEVFNRVGVGAGALVYADVDRFKNLNDTLGHPAGDAALVHFARIIREQIRTVDVAGRIGGEEFAVWLPETGLDLGGKIAERIRIKLGHHRLGLARPAVALERLLRRRGVPRDQPEPRQPAGPGRLGPVRGQAERAEPGGEGGAVGRTGGQVVRKPAGNHRIEKLVKTCDSLTYCHEALALHDFLPVLPVPFPVLNPLLFPHPGATGFDGFDEGIAACPGPGPW